MSASTLQAVGGRVQRLVLWLSGTFGGDICACKYLHQRRNVETAETETSRESRSTEYAEAQTPYDDNNELASTKQAQPQNK